MVKVNNELKEKRFRFPGTELTGFGRRLSCAADSNNVWSAVQMEHNGVNSVVVCCRNESGVSHFTLAEGSSCFQPVIVMKRDNHPAVLWNEVHDRTWKIRAVEFSGNITGSEEIETVYSSTGLCLPPVATYFNGRLCAVWAAVDGDDIRIMMSEKYDGQWNLKGALSKKGVDAFRPSVCCDDKKLCVFWDQYHDRNYELAGKIFSGSDTEEINPFASGKNERWFCPSAVMGENSIPYVAWVGMHEVSDDLGIIDHHPFVMVGRFVDGNIEILTDDTNSSVIAELREGLLPSVVSKGYLGLRRNPGLTRTQDGKMWLLWEVRIEDEATAVCGYLVGRCFDGKSWSEPYVFSNDGYGYSVTGSSCGESLPCAYFRFDMKELDIIALDRIDLKQKQPYHSADDKWTRWNECHIPPLVKNSKNIVIDNEDYNLFWADTHCHSNFSADAEGEVDEIIHFARDIAGLDALCVIDNDYYPHKMLTEPEWRTHQEFSRHFTKPGEFVLFPGYEFTYHREDLDPDFNHRCVIYPGAEGKMFRRIDPKSDSDYKLLSCLKKTDAMCYPHHCGYELIDPDKEWNVEVCSSWRTVLAECDFSIQQLLSGKKFGFIGSSDAHRANPGLGGALTGIIARELTPDALFEAYRKRRLIATQGFAVHIDFRVADLFIGEEGTVAEPPVITANIVAPERIEYTEIIRNGISIYHHNPETETCEFSFQDTEAEAGKNFYFLKLKLIGDPALNYDPEANARFPFSLDSKYPHNLAKARGVFAWTSPIWLKYK